MINGNDRNLQAQVPNVNFGKWFLSAHLHGDTRYLENFIRISLFRFNVHQTVRYF